jgi:AraC-like DNA-binding protein
MSDLLVDTAGPPYLVRGRFGDFDELAEATAGWDLDFRQLDGGVSPAELVQLAEPQTSLIRARLERHYHQRGSSPHGARTFALVEEKVEGVRWCRHSVTENTLMSFHPGGDFDAVSQPGFDVYTLSFSEERLAETAATLGLPEIGDLIGDAEKAALCDPSAMQDLREELRLLSGEIAGGASPLGASSLRQELEFEIPARVLRTLASSRVEAPKPPSRVRDLGLKRALSFIEQNAKKPLAVPDVCRAAGVSWRTLDYAFREEFGVTPKAYLKSIRLNGVRRELRRAAQPVVISDVANRWGFWHMGQFAADYRKLFGELPSETLARVNAGGG